jgi:Do/DeqQ family serine protease
MITPAVVHIRSSYENRSGNNGAMDQFFDYFGAPRGNMPRGATGSGVIISDDGYIVTNNHVIEDADDIEVILDNNESYEGTLIGTDPNTDLALIKIEQNNLPFLTYGNSDEMRIGEWVLAVGNPFDLTSTVTAGIISAKARNINILRRNYGIEAFIQTDAAVNPGNSGGALVNLKGELIGINTAIATRTGSYSGYSFAVPVSLVEKVVSDLKEYGVVQRAILGINIVDVNKDLVEEEDLTVSNGVYILGVGDGSAADEADIREGDVIISINETKVTNTSELQELVARNRPGDRIKVKLIRDGKSMEKYATLKNMNKNYEIIERASMFNFEGAELNDLDDRMYW